MAFDIEANKQKFIQIYNGEIHREGADKLLSWLINSDFFEAPYTGQYVLSCKGGACQHALNTFKALSELVAKYRETDPLFLCDEEVKTRGTEEEKANAIAELDQSVAIAGLLCEVGLANSWTPSVRSVQDSTGKWNKVPCWKWDEEFSYGGTGGKSAFIIQQFMRLYIEEAQAIRFHKQGKEIPYGSNFEDSFYSVYETNMFAALVGIAHNEAHNISDMIIWNQTKPKLA